MARCSCSSHALERLVVPNDLMQCLCTGRGFVLKLRVLRSLPNGVATHVDPTTNPTISIAAIQVLCDLQRRRVATTCLITQAVVGPAQSACSSALLNVPQAQLDGGRQDGATLSPKALLDSTCNGMALFAGGPQLRNCRCVETLTICWHNTGHSD
jgi:hypothetical protein